VRKSVEQQCAKAEAEVESPKSIISALMARRNQQFQQQQQQQPARDLQRQQQH
jgi:hypothetical protein